MNNPEPAPTQQLWHFRPVPGVRVGMVAIADNGDGDRALQLCNEVADDLRRQFSAAADGLNLARVEAWFDAWGLHRVQVIVVDGTRAEELERFLRARAGGGIPTNEADSYVSAVYLPNFDLVVVLRDYELERRNSGPEITECIIVHELAHGSSRHRSMRVLTDETSVTLDTARLGQQVLLPRGGLTGQLLEEGFCDYLRGMYVSEALRRPCGLFPGAPGNLILSAPDATTPAVGVPAKYGYARHDGSLSVGSAGAAGAVIDLLIANNNDLLSTLVRARHEVAALREAAALIDAIHPGLYRTLRDEPDFHRGLDYLTALLAQPRAQATASA